MKIGTFIVVEFAFYVLSAIGFILGSCIMAPLWLMQIKSVQTGVVAQKSG